MTKGCPAKDCPNRIEKNDGCRDMKCKWENPCTYVLVSEPISQANVASASAGTARSYTEKALRMLCAAAVVIRYIRAARDILQPAQEVTQGSFRVPLILISCTNKDGTKTQDTLVSNMRQISR
jgi:hypothetical protein